MGLPRSTFYDAPEIDASDDAIVVAITAICAEFESYGYRRVGLRSATRASSSTARRSVG